jgi:hypothetical protein
MSFWQACCAVWNRGDRGSIPEADEIEIWPPAFGSGKFGSPWERMQAANLARFGPASWIPAPPPPPLLCRLEPDPAGELPPPAPADGELPLVVVGARLATEACDPPPPQPAANSTGAANMVVSRTAAPGVLGRLRRAVLSASRLSMLTLLVETGSELCDKE